MVNFVKLTLGVFYNVFKRKKTFFTSLLWPLVLPAMRLDSDAQTQPLIRPIIHETIMRLNLTAAYLMKKTFIINYFAFLLFFLCLGEGKSWGQQFWRTDGTSSTWTSSVWGTSSSGPFTNAWGSSNARFTANSSATFATTTVGNVTVDAGITVTVSSAGTASGTVVRTYDIGIGSTLTWSGQSLSTSSGFGVIKNGAGTWDMGVQGNAFNPTNGGFIINAGTVIVGGNNNFGGSGSALTINGGTIQSSGTRAYANNITLGGNHTHTGTGNATFSGTVGLGAATRTITNSITSGSRIYSGVISGTSGSGLTFDGASPAQIYIGNSGNTFTGTITISGAEVGFASNGAFGNANNTIVINGGRLTSSTTGGASASYTLASTHGIQLGSTAGTSISPVSGGTLTYDGVMSDLSGNTGAFAKQGSGTFAIGGVSTYTGATSINNGTIQLTTGNDRLPTTTVISLGQASSTNLGTLDLNGRNQTIAGLSSTTGTSTTGDNTVTSAIAATLTINSSTSNSYGDGTNANSGIITGAISLVKSGSGTQTFGDANTYTGTTTLSAGILQLAGGNVGSVGAITSSPIGTSTLNLNGGTFSSNGITARTVLNATSIGGDITLGDATNTGALSFNAAATISGATRTLTIASAVTFAGAIGDGGNAFGITKGGSGTLSLTATNTYTGLTTINAGTLQLNRTGGTTLPVGNSITVSNTGTLQISSAQQLVNVSLAAGTTLTVDAGTTLTITGTLTVNTGATISGSGSIAYSSGAIIYNGSGNLTAGAEWPTSSVPSSVTINSGATVTLGGTRTTTTTLTVNGTLNASTFSITGTGTVNINGIFITSNLNGFTGTGASFTGATPTLGASSNIEYAALSGTQVISTSPSYVNLTLSGGGTKTAASALSISGTLTISGTTIFDAGNSSIGGTGTNLTMTGTSTFRLAGTGTRPSMTGTYALANTSTIEFSNSAVTQQDIRTTPTYGNVTISGSSVGLSSSSGTLTLQSGSSFTVKNGATFNILNTNGFSGASNTAISNTNSPTITLETNSTLNYNGSSTQVISNRSDYKKLILTGGNTKTLSSSITIIEDINLSTTNDILSIGSNTLTLNGTITGSGTIEGGTSAKITINGTGAFGTLNMNQTSATTRSLSNLIINRTSSGTVTNGDSLIIIDSLVLNNGTLTTGGRITLASSATKTAVIPEIRGTGAISGDIIAERFVSSQGRRWRFGSSSFSNATFEDLRQEIYITGVGTGNTAGTLNSNGFDATLSNQPSVFSYSEPVAGDLNQGWTPLTNNTSSLTNQTIVAGRGYRLFIRGDRSDIGRLTGTNMTQNAVTLNLKGTINAGDIIMPVSFTSNSTLANDGWNLLGNPYPCAFDWNAFYDDGTNLTNIDPTIWILDATSGSYKSYNATSSGTLTNGIIPLGASFWVKANAASPSITFKEQFKTASVPIALFKTSTQDALELMLKLDSNTSDNFLMFHNPTALSTLDGFDIRKLNGTVNMMAVGSDSVSLALDARPLIVANDTINLFVSGGNATYQISVLSLPVANGKTYYLRDKKTGVLRTLADTTIISYTSVSTDPSSFGYRFQILISNNNALPVLYELFKATKHDKTKVMVEWITSQEINNHYFEIERSSDNRNTWNILDKINGFGRSNTQKKYRYIDENPDLDKVNYYRIKQVDFDNQTSYSPIQAVSFNTIQYSINIHPNPVKDILYIESLANIQQMELMTVNGKTVTQYLGASSLDMSELSSGIYILKLTLENGEKEVRKIIKQ